ncbi:MAG: 2-hydroxyacyl-CoA dehydratase family protein [Dehalococcoidia bacterium]
MEDEKRNVYIELTQGFAAMKEELAEENPIRAAGYGMIGDIYGQAAEASERGDPVAWISFGVPPEIFLAMDIVPICDVALGILGSFPGVVQGYVDLANELVPDYICSTNRLPLGLALAGDIPHPDVLVVQNNPCDSIMGTDPAISRYFGLPFYGISTPYTDSEAGYQYVASEMKKAVLWLEEHTGRKMDIDRLREVMKHSNRAHEVLLKLNKLAMKVPCPFAMRESQLDYVLFLHIAGKPELVDFLEGVYKDTQDRIAGKTPLPIEEKLRLVWTYAMPAYDPVGGIFDWLEEEHGAINIIYMNNNIIVEPTEDLSDYDSIMKALAKKSLAMPMSRECRGPMESWLNSSLDMVRDYKADGAVFAGHAGCKANWAVAKLVKDAIQEQYGVPTVNIELDFIDSRLTPTDELIKRFDDFLPLVAEAKKKRTQG